MILTVTMNPAIDKRYTVDGFNVGAVNRVTECLPVPGGKGINVAKNIALLGENVTATGLLGGHAGAYVAERLRQYGVDEEFTRFNGETRTCINIKDTRSGTQTELLEPGDAVGAEYVAAFYERFEQLAAKADVVTVSGSVPKGVGTSVYSQLIGTAKRLNKPILMDTSGELLSSAVSAVPTLIKPNTDEITQLTGSFADDPLTIIRAAWSLHERGIPYVAVSLGKDGVIFVCGEGIYKGVPADVPVVNTVGCGDSMLASFAVGLARRMNIEDMLRLSLAVSSANAMREETGYFVMSDMERLLDKVEVTKI